jgi:hypothetical protein
LLKKYYGHLPAFIITIIFIISFTYLINEGNFPQEYILSFQFISLFVLCRKSFDRLSFQDAGIIGLCGSCSFLLQPNATGLWIFIFLILIFQSHNNKKNFLKVIGFFIGISIPLLITISFFFSKNSLYDLYDQVITYNYYYSVVPAINRILALYVGFLFFLLSGIILFAAFGYTMIVINYFRKNTKNQRDSILFSYTIFGSIIELILSSLSGRYSSNYYITWLPFLTILCAYTFFYFSNAMPKKIYSFLLVCILLFNCIIVCFYSYLQIKNQIKYNETYTPLVEWISTHTKQSDTILFWGHNVRYLFLTKRKSPTRFAYQYALFTKGYTSERIIDDYLRDLKSNSPKYIIETQEALNFTEPYSRHKKKVWHSIWPTYQSSPFVQKIYDYVDQKYQIEVSNIDWKIYKIKKSIIK